MGTGPMDLQSPLFVGSSLRDGRLSGYSASFIASACSHVAVVLLIAFAARIFPASKGPNRVITAENPKGIVWLAMPGPGGGGGGGGDRSPLPARQLQLRGSDRLSVPVRRTVVQSTSASPKKTPKLVPPLDIAAVAMARGLEELPGVVIGPPAAPGNSAGPGRNGGGGEGEGGGGGPGKGPGLGAGEGGNAGDGPRRVGNGVSNPVLVREITPRYTDQAMRARVQGVVELDAVVLADGSVGPIQIVRSLDPTFGLDERAIEAVRQWRFRPGLLAGQPISVLVHIELTFTLH